MGAIRGPARVVRVVTAALYGLAWVGIRIVFIGYQTALYINDVIIGGFRGELGQWERERIEK